ELRKRLLAGGQILEWAGAPTGPGDITSVEPAIIPGIVLDDSQAKLQGRWTVGNQANNRKIGTGYVHDNDSAKGELAVRWTTTIPEAGDYDLIVHFAPFNNRATNVPVTVERAGAA